MRHSVSARSLFLAAVLTASCSGSTQAETAPLEVGQAYKILVGMAALQFKILEIGKGGLVKVQAIQSAEAMDIENGSIWWLNLNQVLLVQAIK